MGDLDRPAEFWQIPPAQRPAGPGRCSTHLSPHSRTGGLSVNALLLFLGAALAADPEPTTQNTYFSAQSYFDPPAIAQNPVNGQNPVFAPNPGHATYDDDPLNGGAQTYAPGAGPFATDPSLGQPPGEEFGH